MNNRTNLDEVYLYEMDDEGNPIPETAQKLGNIEHIDITAEDTNAVAISPHELEDSTPIAGWTEIICANAVEEDRVNKQLHYDETHSRKSNWHKRYF